MDKNKWNDFVTSNGPLSGSFLQSYEWGEFQKALGRKVIRILENNFVAQIIKMPLILGLSYFYIPKGPVIKEFPIFNFQFPINCHSEPAYQSEARCGISCSEESCESPQGDLQNIILNRLASIAKKENVIFIRFEPEKINEEKIKELNLARSRDIQPKQTLILDLEKSFDDLLGSMHPKTRYNIRLAEKHGIEIKSGNNFGDFLSLLKKTGERNKFRLHPDKYYKKMLESLTQGYYPSPALFTKKAEKGSRGNSNEIEMTREILPERRETESKGFHIKLWTAKYKNQTIAANLIGYLGPTATYLHGASSSNFRYLMAPYLLHWKIIKDAKISGFKYYDFWGIDEKKWPGVTRFKKGFGGEELKYPGTFDLPINKNLYKIYQLARKVRLIISSRNL